MLLVGLFYLLSVYLALKTSHSNKTYIPLGLIILAGVAFRLALWPLSPTLSDDPFRYRWEGKLQAAGGNPYAARPNDARWSDLRDSTFPRVTGKDFKAVYGPLTELVELISYRVASALESDPVRQVFWFKLPYALCDLAVLMLLPALLINRGFSAERVLIYAWSPLPVIAFWATGHNDSLVILLLTLAFLGAAKDRWTWAFAALSFATAAKIWPLMLFPLFIGWRGYRPLRWYQWWVAMPILFALAWPYRTNVDENLRFMSGFVGGWRNNDSLFGIILWLTKDLYRAKKVAFAIIAAGIAFVTLRNRTPERGALAVIALMLMVSANCHPWYLTWILPLLTLFPVPALLLWTALVPIAYAAVISWSTLGEWNGSTELRWLEYAPVYALLAGSWIMGRSTHLRNTARTTG